MGVAWNTFVEHVANTDFAKRLSRGAANAARAVQEGLRTASDEENAVAATRKRVEIEKELIDLQQRNSKVPAVQGRITYLRGEVARLKEEEDKLYDNLRRRAQETEAREGAPPAIGSNRITPDEQKNVDKLRDALNRERKAMRGTSAERQVRLAGLEAERAALEAGRGPEAAKAERLIAEDRARLQLNTTIGDTVRQLSTEARGNLAVAAAYLQSAAAGQAAEARRQAMLESLQTGVDVQARSAQLLSNQAAAAAAEGAKTAARLQQEASSRQKVAAAALGGASALHEAELQARIEQETLAENIALRDADAETTQRLTDVIKAKTEAIRADDKAQQNIDYGKHVTEMDKELKLLECFEFPDSIFDDSTVTQILDEVLQ